MTKITPIKHVFSISRRMVDPTEFRGADVYHYSLPVWHETGTGAVESAADLASGKLLLKGNEILVSKLNPEKGAVVLTKAHEFPIICSPEFIALTPRDMSVKYAFFMMLSAPVRAQLEASVESVTNSHKRARVERFLASKVSIPDLQTQKAIADFLDRETARIDALIEKKQRMIALVDEKRSALITAAVTGQTGPGAVSHPFAAEATPKSPRAFAGGGGVSNFPLVPSRRHIESVLNGTTATQIDFNENVKAVTRIETISDGTICLDRVGYVNDSDNIMRFKLNKGDLLFSHINSMAMIGNCAIYNEGAPLYVGMNLLRIRPSAAAFPKFLFYCLRSPAVQQQIKNFAKPAINQASISTTNLKRIILPLPAYETQKAIADFLDRETARIDTIKSKTAASIDRLREHRAALITAAVTGQIDVTTWQRRGHAERHLDQMEESLAG